METKKILVLGESGSGKKTLLEHICENLVKTEAACYGKTTMNCDKLQIFSPSGAERFKFMKEVLSKNIDGAIILIDNTQGITINCVDMIESVKEKSVPCVIFANKQDLSDTPPHPYSDVPTVPTEAVSGKGISNGLYTLLEMMDTTYGEKRIQVVSC